MPKFIYVLPNAVQSPKGPGLVHCKKWRGIGPLEDLVGFPWRDVLVSAAPAVGDELAGLRDRMADLPGDARDDRGAAEKKAAKEDSKKKEKKTKKKKRRKRGRRRSGSSDSKRRKRSRSSRSERRKKEKVKKAEEAGGAAKVGDGGVQGRRAEEDVCKQWTRPLDGEGSKSPAQEGSTICPKESQQKGGEQEQFKRRRGRSEGSDHIRRTPTGQGCGHEFSRCSFSSGYRGYAGVDAHRSRASIEPTRGVGAYAVEILPTDAQPKSLFPKRWTR